MMVKQTERLVPLATVLAVIGGVFALARTPGKQSSPAQFTVDDKLVFPENYREWVYLSSGLGMTYGSAAAAGATPRFDNVFVDPEAYRAFQKTGDWPEQTMFVLEVRAAASEDSINRGGHFQKSIVAIEAEMKDTKKFAGTGGWAFFGFGNGRAPAAKFGRDAGCNACHSANGAVDNTFVQFYPTLIDIAVAHKTFKANNR